MSVKDEVGKKSFGKHCHANGKQWKILSFGSFQKLSKNLVSAIFQLLMKSKKKYS